MNRDKLIKKLERWATKRKSKGFDDSILRAAVAEICESQRQLELARAEIKKLKDNFMEGLR